MAAAPAFGGEKGTMGGGERTIAGALTSHGQVQTSENEIYEISDQTKEGKKLLNEKTGTLVQVKGAVVEHQGEKAIRVDSYKVEPSGASEAREFIQKQ